MELTKRLPYSLELSSGSSVRFADLPGLIANALRKTEMEREAAEEDLWRELCDLVDKGKLIPLNAATMGPHSFPVGDGLRRSVLLPESLRGLLEARGIELRLVEPGNGPDLWTLENASSAIAQDMGWTAQQAATLCAQMLDAARNGGLIARHPHTDLPVPLKQRASVRVFYELVTRDDVNVWLVSIGAPFRWAAPDKPKKGFIAGRKLWTLLEAISSVVAMPGFGVTEESLRERVQQDAASGKLTLRSEEHGGAIQSDWGAVVLRYHLFAEDFNAWLQEAGFSFPYRLPCSEFRTDQSGQSGVAPACTAEPAPANWKTAKRWTPDALASLSRYRDLHGAKLAGEKFNISEQRVRQLLPRTDKANAGYSVFNRNFED